MRPTLTMQKKKPKSKCSGYPLRTREGLILTSFFVVDAVNDDLVKDCLSVLYNCCICVSILFHSVLRSHQRNVFLLINVYFKFPNADGGSDKEPGSPGRLCAFSLHLDDQ